MEAVLVLGHELRWLNGLHMQPDVSAAISTLDSNFRFCPENAPKSKPCWPLESPAERNCSGSGGEGFADVEFG